MARRRPLQHAFAQGTDEGAIPLAQTWEKYLPVAQASRGRHTAYAASDYERPVAWTVRIPKREVKQGRRLSGAVTDAVADLVADLHDAGPVQASWPNYGKISGKTDCHHCHVRKGRPTVETEEAEGTAEEKEYYTPEEVFGPPSPAKALRGYRYREALTQAQLAELVGVSKQNISDMECGRRTIGKEMAQRLGTALNASWKRFL